MIRRNSPNEPLVVFLKALASAIGALDYLPPKDRSSEGLLQILNYCLDKMPEVLDNFPGVYEEEHIIGTLRIIRHGLDTFLEAAERTDTAIFMRLIREVFPENDS